MSKKPLSAWLLLILLAAIWGSSFILIKKGLIALSPQELASLRIVSAFVISLPFGILRVRKINRTKLPYLLGSGLLGSLMPAFLFAIAQTKLESAITGVLNALVPIFTIMIALIMLKQRQPKKVWVGVLIGFIGTTILVTAGGRELSGINIYALLVVLATICYASNLNLIKIHLSRIPALSVTSISLLMVGPAASVHLFFFTDFLGKFGIVEGIEWATLYISLLGIFGTAIALIIFNKILQKTSPLFTSSVTYIIPVVAVLWGLADGESLNFVHFLGMAAVGLGVYIANTNRAS